MYDMIATNTGDLLLYKATNRALEVFAYFDIKGLMDSQTEPITLAPHATKTVVYSKTCQFPDIENGFTRHPQNTPSIRTLHQLPVLTEFLSYSSIEDSTKWTLAAHWLNPDDVLAQLKSDVSTNFDGVHRKFHHVDGQISQVTEAEELKAFGDLGRNALWVGEATSVGANPSRSLYLLPIHSPADDPTPEEGLDLCEGLRTLELPIVLDGMAQLGFCDASGTAMVVKDGMTDDRRYHGRITRGGSYRGHITHGRRYHERIHFFQY